MPTAIFTPRVVRENRRVDKHRNERSWAERDIRVAHHGWFTSWKLRTTIAYRGLDAFHFLCLAELHPSVAFVFGTTEGFDWFDGSDWQTYHPRYVITLRANRFGVQRLVDIEVLSSIQMSEERGRWRRIRSAAREAGRTLLIFTERQLNAEPRRTNAELVLHQAGDGLVTEEERSLLWKIAIGTKSFSLNEVVATQLLIYPRAYSTALNMVARGELQFSLGRRFDGDTKMWRAGR